MIQYKKGNLLDVQSGIIVHGCNAQGVMGSGVALAVKQKYPGAYQKYKDMCYGGIPLGSVVPYHANDELLIANAITQEKFGTNSKRYVSYDAIDTAFRHLWYYAPTEIEETTIHFPKIGAGLGGGDWEVINKIIESATRDVPYRELICWEL